MHGIPRNLTMPVIDEKERVCLRSMQSATLEDPGRIFTLARQVAAAV